MVHVDPIVHAVPPDDRPDLADEARQHAYEEAYEAWDMLAGKRHPELGGAPEILDVVGVNVYHFSQAQMNEDKSREVLGPRDPRRKPLGELLQFAWERYHRPIIIGETSGYQDKRAEWLTMTMEESLRALNSGVDLQGVCLYPCVDIPDWNSGELAQIGIYDLKDTEACERVPCDAYIEELHRWQQILDHPQHVEPDALRAGGPGHGAAVRGAPPRPGVGGADPGQADGGRPVTGPAAYAPRAPRAGARSWQLAGAFDAGEIRGWTPDFQQELHFHQLELTGHAEQLEGDYRLLREEFGLRRFRDGAWLARSLPAPGQIDWTYLDRLAGVSRGEVTLSLCHYEWPPGSSPRSVERAGAGGHGRFRRAGRAPVPGTLRRLHPRGGERVLDGDDDRLGALVAGRASLNRGWGERGDRRAGRRAVCLVAPLRRGGADAGGRGPGHQGGRPTGAGGPLRALGLAPPTSAWRTRASLQHPPGPPRPGGSAETGSDAWGGDPSLLDEVGLNFYNNWGVDHGWPLSRLLLEARRHYPQQRIIMGETGNCHFSDCHTVAGWLDLIDQEVQRANAGGARRGGRHLGPCAHPGRLRLGPAGPGGLGHLGGRRPPAPAPLGPRRGPRRAGLHARHRPRARS